MHDKRAFLTKKNIFFVTLATVTKEGQSLHDILYRYTLCFLLVNNSLISLD
jgi:hypothetical protein